MRVHRRTKAIVAAAALGTVVAAGAGMAAANSGHADEVDETDTPIVGNDLDRAAEAALAYTRQGRVTATEVGDEESFYEVEVTLDDGSQLDVQLDEQFHVVGDETDTGDGD